VELAERVMSDVSIAVLPGAHLVDSFTWCALISISKTLLSNLIFYFILVENIPSWFPGAGFKREAARMSCLARDFANVPYEYAKGQMVICI
jgi:hypothetical protein